MVEAMDGGRRDAGAARREEREVAAARRAREVAAVERREEMVQRGMRLRWNVAWGRVQATREWRYCPILRWVCPETGEIEEVLQDEEVEGGGVEEEDEEMAGFAMANRYDRGRPRSGRRNRSRSRRRRR